MIAALPAAPEAMAQSQQLAASVFALELARRAA